MEYVVAVMDTVVMVEVVVRVLIVLIIVGDNCIMILAVMVVVRLWLLY